jgi:hypothetical protein
VTCGAVTYGQVIRIKKIGQAMSGCCQKHRFLTGNLETS